MGNFDLMKRKFLLGFGAALLVFTTSCGPKRYGCNKRRCLVDTNTKEVLKQNTTTTRNA
jgi:hypothetical protein